MDFDISSHKYWVLEQTSRANSTFSLLGSKSRQLWLSLEKKKKKKKKKKNVVITLALHLSMDLDISSHICGYDNILSKFDFQGPGLKVEVDMSEIFSIM